jgi:hypothetical protein
MRGRREGTHIYLVVVGNNDGTENVLSAHSRKLNAEKHIDRLFACAEGSRSNAAMLGIRSSRIARMIVDEN